MNKKQKIILIVCVTLAILAAVFYFFVYNPKNSLGEKCQTAYNLSHYEYSDGFKIDIPENSCFVNTCCMIGHRFRTHENYDSLNAKLQKIVDNLWITNLCRHSGRFGAVAKQRPRSSMAAG